MHVQCMHAERHLFVRVVVTKIKTTKVNFEAYCDFSQNLAPPKNYQPYGMYIVCVHTINACAHVCMCIIMCVCVCVCGGGLLNRVRVSMCELF